MSDKTAEGRNQQDGIAGLLWLSFGCLAVAIAVYVLDRPWSSAAFMAPFAELQPARVNAFGPFAANLPSFLHAYAFSTLLAIAVGLAPRRRALACASWCAMATLLELLQTHKLSALLSDPSTPGGFLLTSLRAYALQGHFDLADVIATVLGCAAAFITPILLRRTT